MSRYDRLSTLIDRFALNVYPDPGDAANLQILQQPRLNQPGRILLAPLGSIDPALLVAQSPLFTARIEWGGAIILYCWRYPQ